MTDGRSLQSDEGRRSDDQAEPPSSSPSPGSPSCGSSVSSASSRRGRGPALLHRVPRQRPALPGVLFTAPSMRRACWRCWRARTPTATCWAYGRDTTRGLISVYAMRMAAVFTLSVSTVVLRASALPRWVSYSGYVVALALLFGSAEQKWLQLLFPGWVLLLSVVILLTSPVERLPRKGAPGPSIPRVTLIEASRPGGPASAIRPDRRSAPGICRDDSAETPRRT